jgi:hypothetical protein
MVEVVGMQVEFLLFKWNVHRGLLSVEVRDR